MRGLGFFVVPALLFCLPLCSAQSAVDLVTLADLKAAAKRMNLEQPDGSPFRLEASVETTDCLGKPEGAVKWVEEFSSASTKRRTLTVKPDAAALPGRQVSGAENRAPYMQRYLMDCGDSPGS